MVVLAPAILFIFKFSLENGFARHEKVGLVFVWSAPILARPSVEYLAFPIGFLAMFGLFILIILKAIASVEKGRASVDKTNLGHALDLTDRVRRAS
jgi:hypothetical protein